MIGRQSQIEQNAIDGRDLQTGEHLRKLRITGLDEVATKGRESMGRNVQHQGVPVKTDQGPLWPDSPENFATVSPGADRAVDDNQPRLEL